MIGRASRGNPWIFRQVSEYLEMEKLLSRRRVTVKNDAASCKAAARTVENTPESVRCENMFYMVHHQDFRIRAKLRKRVNEVESIGALEELPQSWELR